MFGKEVNLSKNNTSIIAKDLFIKGDLKSDGLIEIEGRLIGNVDSNIVTLRESSNVDGNIVAKVVNIKGRFNGIIKGERINISGKANIKGTLEYLSLCVEDGACIDGELKRINNTKNNKLESKNEQVNDLSVKNEKNESKNI